jgi:hypothetical protein
LDTLGGRVKIQINLSLIPVVHLVLRIFTRILEKKLEMTLMLFPGAWGKTINEKKPQAKNLVTLSLYQELTSEFEKI